jgi:hypothetical protein
MRPACRPHPPKPKRVAKHVQKIRPTRHWLLSIGGAIEIVVAVGHIAAAVSIAFEHFS